MTKTKRTARGRKPKAIRVEETTTVVAEVGDEVDLAALNREALSEGATMDGPTLPEHANLVEPEGSITCYNCGLVYAGRANCPNCGVDAKGEQYEAHEAARRKAGLPAHLHSEV